ncbi:uncharacterized protein LOC117654344 [Thrips palmi]|uniref:Uncharacterized protein LOC117654344 n=1 Tax=Thrips palmi TaxID=161013 RepID=A0A6P9AMM6_THRPL|nr:uncharacterized protein LOC117654344 [Thrips palmi]XP_034256821.1 uncharacterized protein LOC117654344 [Thrips palmi]XP_034256822.1 uncharacterized protein LOC117654344 [Thrips palmi]XP_034256823.1 uncharacterized protein LOC117654344 [Thrips palmi]
MGAKTGAKAGRPLKQNGKNKAPEKEETPVGPDYSILRKPVEISVSGLNEVIKVFQSCSTELHHLLSHECDVVYECKVCRNLFRSLANFISHKRVYCTQLQGNTGGNVFKSNKRVHDTTVIVEPESVRTTRSRENWRTSDAIGSEEGKEVYEPKTRNALAEPAPFRITIKKDLTSIVEKLMQKTSSQTLTETVGHLSSSSEFYDGVSKELKDRQKDAKQQTIHLEPIENTSFGVFQTIVQTSGSSNELIKSQVQDLQRIMSDTEAVLGPDGRVIDTAGSQSNTVFHEDRRKKSKAVNGEEYNGPPVTAPESEVELFCNLCKEHFPSYKTLNHHMKTLHMTYRTFYPCPCCKVPLSNSWSVYRHLLKVHRKTNEQIRKLREKVIKRSFKKEVLQSGAQKLLKSNVSENPLCPSELIFDASQKPIPTNDGDSYKQWFGHDDDGLDMQCCGGCGRRFERKVALLAHFQSCSKNSGKQNSSGSSKTPTQSEKPATVGRISLPNKGTASPNVLGLISPVASSRSSTLPVLPLHLSHEKLAVPTKKIEIQIRRDYGKASVSNSDGRTRTPSTSRSEDGAASISRSDDGTSSGSSETDTSGEKIINLQKQNEQQSELESRDFERSRRPSLPGQLANIEQPVKRRVGRPRKNRPQLVQVNGTSVSISDGSDDSNDVRDKQLNSTRAIERRKRKADNSNQDESDEEIWTKTKKDHRLAADHSDKDHVVNSVDEESEDDVFSLKPKTDDQHKQSDKDRRLSSPSSSKNLVCRLCRKKFKSSIDLRQHLTVMHINYNRFRCLICDFRCFSKVDCITHALRMHLDPWEKEKAAGMVQDIQMDAGGSTDIHPYDVHIDSGDSESAASDPSTPSETPEKSEDSSHEELPNLEVAVHEGHTLEGAKEIIGVA